MTPLTALFRALEAAGLGLDVETARDAVWLAALLSAREPPAIQDVERPVGSPTLQPAGAAPPASAETLSPAMPIDSAAAAGASAGNAAPRAATETRGDPTAVVPFSRVRLPRASGLVGARTIPGALRPLRRKRRSPRAPIDETSTVRRAIEDDLWLPMYRQVPERWLELALVVDSGLSMVVWQDTIADLRRIFTRAGAFRSVHALSLASEDPVASVRPMKAGAADRRSPAGSPFGGSRLGLVLVLSDCVSAGWYTGSVVSLLHRWSRDSPVALLQVLPERMWPRTGLGEATRVTIRAAATAVTNRHLHWAAELPLPEAGWRTRGVGVDPADLALFPVATADPASVRLLARMVAGTNDESMPAVLFDVNSIALPPETGTASAEERLRRFWNVSSAAACQLACLLAAVPAPSVAMLRLLRRELLPDADPSAEAEVLFSRLVRVPAGAEVHDGDLPLEFEPDVRVPLLENAPVGRVLEVLSRIAEQTTLPGIAAPTFASWIVNPTPAREHLVPGESAEAAHVASVLEQIGGAYARIVHPEARRITAVPIHEPAAARGDLPADQAPQAPLDAERSDTPPTTEQTTKAVCFVISPFGQRVDYATKRTLDLDKSYRSIIKAAAEDAGLTCLRADEVIHSGTIDKAVFEQLLNAEVVVADLSTSDANTIYLLGVRHVLRPHTTIVIAENQFKFPFDVAHQEIVQYAASRVRHRRGGSAPYAGTPCNAHPRTPADAKGRQPCLHILVRTPASDALGDASRATAGGEPLSSWASGKRPTTIPGGYLISTSPTESIRAAVEETGLECVRADDIVHSGVIDLPMHGAPGHRRPGDCRPVDFERQSDLRARYQTCAASLHDPRHRGEGIPLSVRPRASRSSGLYEHLGTGIDVEEADRLKSELRAAIKGLLANPQTEQSRLPVPA